MNHKISKKDRRNIILKKISSVSSLLILAIGIIYGSSRILNGSEVSAALPDGSLFTVNSTSNNPDINTTDGICETVNSGECTLIAALQEANGNDNPTFRDIIEFNISGAGVHTISPLSTLNTGDEPMLIDGYSQPGASANTNVFPNPLNGTLLIELDFSNLTTPLDSGLAIGTDNFEMRGLVLNSNPVGNTVTTYISDEVDIYGNYFNTDPTGLIARPSSATNNGLGINGSIGVRVGGSLPEQRNVFGPSGGALYAYSAQPGPAESSDITISGNYFGVGADGVTNLGMLTYNSIAIGDGTTDVVIGGPNTEDGNFIENAPNSGIAIGDSSQVPTERVFIMNNRIVGNGGAGISVGDFVEPYMQPQNISIISNSIYLNAVLYGAPGIELAPPSNANINDLLDTDSGANNLLNHPSYIDDNVIESGPNTNITYEVDLPTGDYRIEFFSSPTQTGSILQGYELLGSQNITSLGSGNQEFTYGLTGTGLQNITLTATEINPELPSGFGPTSEFGGSRQRQADVGIEKTLLNPEDIAREEILDYRLTYTNYGSDPVRLSEYSNFAGVPLTSDFMPADLTPVNIIGDGFLPGSFFIDVGNSDLTCLWGGPGSAILYGMDTHPDYSVLACWYTSGAEEFLQVGETIVMDIPTQVSNDSELAFINFAFSAVSDNNNDPDFVGTQEPEGGEDLLDLLYRTNVNSPDPLNNFAITPLPTNIDIEAESDVLDDAPVGTIVNYDITLTNNGVTGFDLSHYLSFPKNLLGGLFPANKLTAPTTDNEDITCISVGPGSYAYIGEGASDHPNHEIFVCLYGGPSQIIAPGESYVLSLQTTITQESDHSVYFFQASAFQDPDLNTFLPEFYGASSDVLDTIANPNYAKTSYNSSQDNVSNNSGNGQNTANSSDSDLSNTGQNVALLVLGGIILMVGSFVIYKKTRPNKTT